MNASRFFSRALVAGGILLSLTSYAMAQTGTNTLAPETIQSALYSHGARKVILSVVEANASGRFVECEAPEVASSKDLTLKSLFNCEDIRETQYIASEDSVAAINRSFNAVFDRNLKRIQQEYKDRSESDRNNRLFSQTAVLVSSGFFSAFVAHDLYFSSRRLDARVNPLRNSYLKGAGAAGAVSVVVGLVALYRIYQGTQDHPLRPLEEGLKENVTTILRRNQQEGFAQLDVDEATHLMSEMVLKAYVMSVKDAVRSSNTL